MGSHKNKFKCNEYTRKDILSAASPEPWSIDMRTRARIYAINISDVDLDPSADKCIISFTTRAAGHSTQTVSISIDDFWPMVRKFIKDGDKFYTRDILDLTLNQGDLHIYCTCPHWVYGGYNYIATQLDYALWKKEYRPPKVRNPNLLGSTCKHGFVVLMYLANNRFRIAKEINRVIKSNSKIRDIIESWYNEVEVTDA